MLKLCSAYNQAGTVPAGPREALQGAVPQKEPDAVGEERGLDHRAQAEADERQPAMRAAQRAGGRRPASAGAEAAHAGGIGIWSLLMKKRTYSN